MPNDTTTELLSCPCGATPSSLSITGDGDYAKWLFVSGDCCGEWMIEFRNNYGLMDSERCRELAREAWQAARRTQKQAVREPLTDAEIDEVWERYDEGIGTRRDLLNRIAKRFGVSQKEAG